jgi:hypothetical protein
MNLPGHRIAACLGKAALKTHALQTLRDRRASPNRAKPSGVRPIYRRFPSGAGRPRFMVPVHAKKRKGALHEPTHPDPSQERCERSSASCQFRSWEGLGVGTWSRCLREAKGGFP